MEKVLAVLVGFCCLAMFSSVSVAAVGKNVQGAGKGVQLERSTTSGSQASGGVDTMSESARKKIGKNIKRSSEHGSVRGTINGSGEFI